MSSAIAKASKYTYRSTGEGTANVSIEYSADLTALSRLEVGFSTPEQIGSYFYTDRFRSKWIYGTASSRVAIEPLHWNYRSINLGRSPSDEYFLNGVWVGCQVTILGLPNIDQGDEALP